MERGHLSGHTSGVRSGRKNIGLGGATLLLIAIAGYAGMAFYQTRPHRVVTALLRLDESPSSLRNVECESWGFSDVLTTCAFEIDPSEFPKLLAGWPFAESAASGQSYAYAGGPRVGPAFPVAREFSVTTREFVHGGRVSLVTNAQRTRGQVDYYEE